MLRTEYSKIFIENEESSPLPVFEEAWWPVWILFVRKKVAVESTPITARLDAQACKPDRKFNWIPSNSSWISSPRVVDFQRVDGGWSNTTRIRYPRQILKPSPRVVNDRRSRREIFPSSRIFISRSVIRSFFVSQTKHADVQRVRLSWSLARDREAVVRENQSNHAGTLFTRGRENPIKRREIPLNEEDSSSSRAMNARGWSISFPSFPTYISWRINIIFLKLSRQILFARTISREIFIQREKEGEKGREGRVPTRGVAQKFKNNKLRSRRSRRRGEERTVSRRGREGEWARGRLVAGVAKRLPNKNGVFISEYPMYHAIFTYSPRLQSPVVYPRRSAIFFRLVYPKMEGQDAYGRVQ